MAEQSLIREHRAAIALNNMGVSLLEQRAYRQGMETLKDAIFVMKHVFRPQSRNAGLGATSYSTGRTDVKINRAVQRMTNPQPVPSTVIIDVISHGVASSQSSPLGSILRASSSFAVPIRIEATDLDCPEDRDPELESAIMLYNFGLAHLCMAKLAKSPNELREGALKLFNMAYSIISNKIISNKNTLSRLSASELQIISETRLLLAFAVLNNVARVLTEMGNHTEANTSYRRLARLGTAINELDYPGSLGCQIAAAAAA
jgi:tetratricopeptide (TPR) repeat protein